jgi:hypothetical protein
MRNIKMLRYNPAKTANVFPGNIGYVYRVTAFQLSKNIYHNYTLLSCTVKYQI